MCDQVLLKVLCSLDVTWLTSCYQMEYTKILPLFFPKWYQWGQNFLSVNFHLRPPVIRHLVDIKDVLQQMIWTRLSVNFLYTKEVLEKSYSKCQSCVTAFCALWLHTLHTKYTYSENLAVPNWDDSSHAPQLFLAILF